MITLAISKLAVLTRVQFLLYAVKPAAQDQFVGPARLDFIAGSFSSLLPSPLESIRSDLGFYKVADRMRMGLALFALVFHRVIEIDCCSNCGSDDFFLINALSVLYNIMRLRELRRYGFRRLIMVLPCPSLLLLSM